MFIVAEARLNVRFRGTPQSRCFSHIGPPALHVDDATNANEDLASEANARVRTNAVQPRRRTTVPPRF